MTLAMGNPTGVMEGPVWRVGQGIDIHPFVSGRRLILGGVPIDYHLGLEGHSDADVLLHAVMDALLGAAGLGDIGELFPNTDPKWRGADSKNLLRIVFDRVRQDGWRVVNMDCTILAEAPKLKPHMPAMRNSISSILEINPDECNIKATTSEGLGFVGRREGMTAAAVCLLQRSVVA